MSTKLVFESFKTVGLISSDRTEIIKYAKCMF